MVKKNQTVETAEINREATSATTLSAAELIAKFGSVSGAIRGLAAEGKSRGDIAKMLNKRYQHVRNVLITPVKKTATANS